MTSSAYSKIIDLVDDLTFNEQVEVRDWLISIVSDKEARFTEVVQQLVDALNTIQDEFPYAYIPLQIESGAIIDLNTSTISAINAEIEG